jgi:hypothetical protein
MHSTTDLLVKQLKLTKKRDKRTSIAMYIYFIKNFIKHIIN